MILADDGLLLPNPLPALGAESVVAAPATTLRDSERVLILSTLGSVGWVIGGRNGAAAKLGLNRSTLINKMKRLGIARPRPENGIDPFQTGQIPS